MSEIDTINALLEERRKRREQPRDDQGKFYKKTAHDYVQQYGLNPRDLRVAELLSRQNNLENPEIEVLRLAASIVNKTPTDADMPSGVAKGVSFTSRQDALWQEYRERSRNLRGNQLLSLKMEMRKKGLRDLH